MVKARRTVRNSILIVCAIGCLIRHGAMRVCNQRTPVRAVDGIRPSLHRTPKSFRGRSNVAAEGQDRPGSSGRRFSPNLLTNCHGLHAIEPKECRRWAISPAWRRRPGSAAPMNWPPISLRFLFLPFLIYWIGNPLGRFLLGVPGLPVGAQFFYFGGLVACEVLGFACHPAG